MKKFLTFFLFLLFFSFLTARPVFGCQSNSECKDGEVCFNGVCEISYKAKQCTSDINCPGGSCIGGWCEYLPKVTIPNQPGPDDPTEDITGKVINPVLPLKLNTMPGVTFLSKFLRTGVSLVFVLGMVIFVFILTTGGVRWLSSSGDKAKLEAAQKQVSSGFVGLVILLSAFAIIQLVQVLFGIDLLSFTLPTL